MFKQPIIHSQNKYRLAWKHPDAELPSYGTFLFNTPEEAQDTISTMQVIFQEYEIWLEDRNHNRIEI